MAVINLNLFSCYLKRKVHVDVIIPSKNFNNLIEDDFLYHKQSYKCLYLLHGSGDNEKAWQEQTNIIELANKYQLVVVMPNAENTYYTNTLYSVKMKSFIEGELFSFIQSTFPVSRDKKNTYIMGNSMGGYGAMKIALSNPHKFGHVCSLSGGLDIQLQVDGLIAKIIDFPAIFGTLNKLDETEHSIKYLINNFRGELPNIDIACGCDDQNLQSTREIINLLEKNKINYKYLEDEGAHTWQYWNYHLNKYFQENFKIK